jgi:hypothetical protein
MADADVKTIVGLVASTDQIGATVHGIGGYLRLVYRAEEFAPIPVAIWRRVA